MRQGLTNILLRQVPPRSDVLTLSWIVLPFMGEDFEARTETETRRLNQKPQSPCLHSFFEGWLNH
jgi:hypothetical protein